MYLDLNQTEEEIYRLAKPYLQNIRDGETHVTNALEFAFRLLETEPGERDIVVPAIILHDVGWDQVPEDIMVKAFGPEADMSLTRIHEEIGLKIAANILEKVGYAVSKASEILKIIDGHDTRQEPLSINDKIVKDADKLTRYSNCFLIFAGILGLKAAEYASYLESLAGGWFFLPASKKMARVELKQWQG